MKYFEISEKSRYYRIVFSALRSANALSLEGARELSVLRKELGKVEKPVVFFSAHAKVFCSGGNLSDYKKLASPAAGLKINREITRHLNQFALWPSIKLAVVEGDVLGGGMEWLARFDVRWSTPAAFFSFWQRRVGLSTGWGGGKAWAALIGSAKVKQLLMESNLLPASEARRLGLIDRIHCSWRVNDEVEVWADGLRGKLATELSGWSAQNEHKTFSNLWMGPEHRQVLAKWKA